MSYFFEHSDIELSKYITWMFENCSPLLVYQDKDNMDIISRIFDVLGVLFKFVIAQMNKDRTKDIIDYLMHELEKNKQNLARQRNVVIFFF